jgi:hypothetical protein
MHKEDDPRRCEICVKEVRTPARDLSLVYISDEEFRLCVLCKKDFITSSRMLFNGLRKIAGHGPKIFRDSSLAGMKKKDVKVSTTGEDKEFDREMKNVAAQKQSALKRDDVAEYKRVFGR